MHLAKAHGSDFCRGDCPGALEVKRDPETNDQIRWCCFISAIFYAKFLRCLITYLTSTGSFALVKHTQSELSLFSLHAFLNSYKNKRLYLNIKLIIRKIFLEKMWSGSCFLYFCVQWTNHSYKTHALSMLLR